MILKKNNNKNSKKKFVFVDQSTENLGVELLSSILKNIGYEVSAVISIVPQSGYELNHFEKKTIIKKTEKILSIDPDFVGFSCFTDSFRYLNSIAKELKQYKNIPTVFGGIHATLCSDALIQKDSIDFIIRGEGEEALPLLLQAINGNIDFDEVPNLVYIQDGQVIKNSINPYIKDLDNLPFPDKDIYSNINPFVRKNYYALTSRGCPFGCSFCSNNALHKIYSFEKNHVRRRSPENVVKELKIAIEKYNTKNIFFADDMFTSDLKWLNKFTELYKKEVKLPFYCASHPLMINSEVVKLLKEGGCYHIEIGFQTPVDKIRKDILGRKESKEHLEKISILCNKYELSFSIDHIFGIPGEDHSHEKKILYYYNRLRPKKIDKFWLNFYPGTEIISTAMNSGLINEKDIEKIENGELAYDYMCGGHLKRFPH